MSLHPQCKILLEQMAAMPGKPFEEMTLADIQDRRAAMPQGFGLGGPAEAVARVENRSISTAAGAVPVRVYWPTTDHPLPVLFYFHGGGWVFGTVEWTDTSCRTLANSSGCVVVSVDYRLAPEHRYPAAVNDCYGVVEYVTRNPGELNVDLRGVGVCGDSAGGNLATVVCQIARDRRGPVINYQILIYPCVDYLDESPSMEKYSEGHFLTEASMKWFWQQYADEKQAREPYLSPIYAQDLTRLPPALVIVAQCDPLCDQVLHYAKRLSEAGVHVKTRQYEGMIHGFFHMGAVVDAGKTVVKSTGELAGKALFAGIVAH